MKTSANTVEKTADKSIAENKERERQLKKVCADFESMLVHQMIKNMRQTIPKGGLLGHSQGQETYEMMLDQKIAEAISSRGDGFGLQKVLFNELKAKCIR